MPIIKLNNNNINNKIKLDSITAQLDWKLGSIGQILKKKNPYKNIFRPDSCQWQTFRPGAQSI